MCTPWLSVLVEHQGELKPPAVVQVLWVTPCQVKGNTQGTPLTVTHPAGAGEVESEKGQQV